MDGSAIAYYRALVDMVTDSDTVVVGHISELQLGRTVEDPEAAAAGADPVEATTYFADASVSVTERLKGAAGTSTLRLQILVPNQETITRLQRDLPLDESIYFLRNMGAYFESMQPGSDLADSLQGVYDFASPQGLMRDVNGLTVVQPQDQSDFVLKFADRPFETVVAQVRAAAESAKS